MAPQRWESATLGRFQTELSATYEEMFVIRMQFIEKALVGISTVDVKRLAHEFVMIMKILNDFQHTSKRLVCRLH